MILRSMLRRSAWIVWLPPIDSPSPSPVITQTSRSGRAILRPLAIAGAIALRSPATRNQGIGLLVFGGIMVVIYLLNALPSLYYGF